MKMKKILALGVIFLFIGVAVAPNINFTVVKASNDNDLVEVTTQACGIKGFGNTTVKLTREQYQNLEQYLIDFRARLNQTTTREEAVPIFKEAVVELNKYGLLPKGMSVEQSQRLVTGQYQNKNMMRVQAKLLHNHLLTLDNNSNYLCLVSGQVNNSCSIFPLINVLSYLTSFFVAFSAGIALLLWLLLKNPLFIIVIIPSMVLQYIIIACWELSNKAPLAILNVVGIGEYWENYPGHGYHESNGWLKSFGLLGKKEWNGGLYGRLSSLWMPINEFLTMFMLPGMIGFSGIKITSGEYNENKFYLGSALAIGISSEPPALPQT